MRPIIDPMGELLRSALLILIALLVASRCLAGCALGGEPFTARADALEVAAQGDAGDVGRVLPKVFQDAAAGDALEAAAGDDAEPFDAGEDARPVNAGECASSAACPVCPGAVPRFPCCHAGACGCVGEGELCTP